MATTTAPVELHSSVREFREEIFGSVVTAIPFNEPEEVAVFANDTIYGLASAVWTRDISKAHRMAAKLRAGTVWINCYNVFDPALPFGGYKQSEWGRENGTLYRKQVGLRAALESSPVYARCVACIAAAAQGYNQPSPVLR